MNKIKYDQLIREFIEVLNPKKNVRYFWKWLTKDVSYIRFKPGNITRNVNYKISEILIDPIDNISKDTDAKSLKILSNIFNVPYEENKEILVKNLKKYVIDNEEKIRGLFIKHMDSMSYDEMSCFHTDRRYDLKAQYFYWNFKTLSGDKYYKNLDKDGLPLDMSSKKISDNELYNKSRPINPEIAKMKMNSDLLNLFNKNYRAINEFQKEKEVYGWEMNKVYEKFLGVYTGILSSDNISKEIDNLTKNLFEDSDNIYKFAVDQNYNLDRSGLGGPYHRLYDESHTVHEMFQKVKDAKPDDTNLTELIAFINEFAKDIQTTMGLPLVSVKKETFDSMLSFLKPFGVSKSDLYDFMTYNLQELMNVCFIIAYYLFPSTRKNKEKLGNVYGFLTVCGSFGNPLAFIVLALTLITSVIKNDFKTKKDREALIKGAAKSAGLSLIIKFAIGIFDIDSMSKLIGFFVGIAVIIILYKKGINKVQMNKFKKEIEKEIEKLSKKSKFILEQSKFLESN